MRITRLDRDQPHDALHLASLRYRCTEGPHPVIVVSYSDPYQRHPHQEDHRQ